MRSKLISFFSSIQERASLKESLVTKPYSFFILKLPGFFRNVWRFRRELWFHRWWDSRFSLLIFQRALLIQLQSMVRDSNEEEESLQKKIKMMKRVIDLLDNSIESNFLETIEKKHGKSLVDHLSFTKNSDGVFRLVDEESSEEKEIAQILLAETFELEEKEWEELWEIIRGRRFEKPEDWDGSDLRSWWN